MIDQIANVASRVLFVAAFVLGGLAVWEKLTNMIGLTLVFLGGYPPARLLELATVALVFVIALQLRDIKYGASNAKGSG
ncbi:MAG: hypothetical protein AMS18_07405 [Gemmatimonas sp. SG8_17]|nr:MAG: hypothetical protein AMS18_07405 [Gemmatimonas sp. SG8_17]